LHSLVLDVFTPEESRAFLKKYLEPQSLHKAAFLKDLDVLAERLGHLPLALELAGRYLERHPRKRLADYVAELDDVLPHRSMRAWREELGNPTGHDLDLATTFALSWEEIEDQAAQRLFLTAGYCAPNEPIPYELLEQAADLDRNTCGEALSYLTGLGLLMMEGPDTGPIIPPLLAEYARALLAGKKGISQPWLTR
jgi:hypothetical protein